MVLQLRLDLINDVMHWSIDDPRLINLAKPNGISATYYGSKDASGNPAAVPSFAYYDPSNPDANFILTATDSQLNIVFNNGTSLTVSVQGQDYPFTIHDAASAHTYSGIYSSATKTIQPASPIPDVVVAAQLRSASENTCAYAVAKDATNAQQEIIVKVTDQCGNLVSQGIAFALVAPNAANPVQNINGKLIIAGDWIGTLTQPNGPISNELAYEMNLSVNGAAVIGTSRVSSGSYFAVVNVTGSVSGNQLTFNETGVTSQKPVPYVVWCLKAGTLTAGGSGNATTLSGSWKATSPPSCLPGTIRLTKVVATS